MSSSITGVLYSPQTPLRESETIQSPSFKIDPESTLRCFIYQVFKTDEEIQNALAAMRQDRFLNQTHLLDMLRGVAEQEVNEALLLQDPLLALFLLIIQGNESTQLRERAAEQYIANFPQDKRFEKNYAYLKSPSILLAHALILGGFWKCSNPKNTAFYDEQIAGLFHGTIAFDQGDLINAEELRIIQEKEGTTPSFPIDQALIQEDSPLPLSNAQYRFTKWHCTPCMKSNHGLDALFIPSRRSVQNQAIESYSSALHSTSAAIQRVFHLPNNQKTTVAVIGAYGAGKTSFLKERFQGEEYVPFSMNYLSHYLQTSSIPRLQDYHFESMMLVSELTQRISQIPCLLLETAAVDPYGLNQLLKRHGQTPLLIHEIAIEEEKEAVCRVLEGDQNAEEETRIGAIQSSVKDAKTFRCQRIQELLTRAGVEYHLYANTTSATGEATFTEIASIANQRLSISPEHKALFETMTPQSSSS